MSGPAKITRDVKDEYRLLRDEMRAKRNIDVEWRVLAKADARWLHGRFFISGDLARNLPPLNLILGGTLDEISPSEIQPSDFDDRWDKATDLATYTVPTPP